MSGQDMYVLEQVEEELRSRIAEYYDIQTENMTLYMASSPLLWTVYVDFPNGKRLGASMKYIDFIGIEVCYAADVDKLFKNLISTLSLKARDCLRIMLNVNTKMIPMYSDLLIKDLRKWKSTLVSSSLIKLFFDIEIQKHPSKPYIIAIYKDKLSGETLFGYFEETRHGYVRCPSDRHEFSEM